jgi:hypothetical protein
VPSNNGITKIRPQDILMGGSDDIQNQNPGPSGRIQMIKKMNNA